MLPASPMVMYCTGEQQQPRRRSVQGRHQPHPRQAWGVPELFVERQGHALQMHSAHQAHASIGTSALSCPLPAAVSTYHRAVLHTLVVGHGVGTLIGMHMAVQLRLGGGGEEGEMGWVGKSILHGECRRWETSRLPRSHAPVLGRH